MVKYAAQLQNFKRQHSEYQQTELLPFLKGKLRMQSLAKHVSYT